MKAPRPDPALLAAAARGRAEKARDEAERIEEHLSVLESIVRHVKHRRDSDMEVARAYEACGEPIATTVRRARHRAAACDLVLKALERFGRSG